MATLTLKSSSYDGRSLQLDLTSTSNGSAKNSSTVKWTLKTVGSDGTEYSTGPTKVVINGTTVYSKERVKWSDDVFPAAKGSTSGELTIPHNTDGTKTINVSFSTAIYTSTVSEYKDTLTLDPIPRYGTVSHSLNSKTETTIKMNWSSDSTVDYLWYSKDNGTNWTGVNVTDGKSGTYTISGLSANTTYKIKTRIRRKDSQLTTDSGALSVTTYNWPHCTNAPDFVVGNAVTLTFYNPLNRTFSFSVRGNGQLIHTWTDRSGTTYTGLSGEPAITNLYNSIPNDFSAQYTVSVTYGTNTTTMTGGRYSVDVSACRPTFTTFDYYDANASVVAITGNDKVIVQGLSAVAVKITSANKMVARNGATPSGYYVTFDTSQVYIPYTDSGNIDVTVGAAHSKEAQRIIINASDSRSNFATAHKDVEVVEYSKPVVYVTGKRRNNFENETTFTVNGTYSPVVVSGVEKNGMISLSYSYREVGSSTWLGSGGFNFTAANGKFECGDTVLNLDNSKEYEFFVAVVDRFSGTTPVTETATVGVGQAIFFISSNERKCYINGKEVATVESVQTVGDDVLPIGDIIDRVYPAGTVFITNTNTNPANILGRGAWTLIDKEFSSVRTNAAGTIFFTPAEGVTNNGTYISRAGHSLTIKQDLIVSQSMTDTGMTLGLLNWPGIGITELPFSINEAVSYADGANGGIVYNIVAGTGSINQVDVFDCTETGAGKSFHLAFTMVIDKNYIADAACDKFFWKRTS